MKKTWNRFKEFIKLFRLDMILLILGMYFVLCLSYYLILRLEGMPTPFWDIVMFNLLTITGNDYVYVDSAWTRVLGVFMLILGMFGLSSITGYVSSAFVARRLNPERGVKKMQNMRDHIIICGWKNDLKGLILGILRKNKGLRVSDLILINNMDEVKAQALRDDAELAGINILRGDFFCST